MESTQKELGANIAALRRQRGLTQEQLARQLGVSAPAVSKWETGSSYPDITLLCPLARALGTNLDRLLQFEPTLSDQEVRERLNALLKDAPRLGPRAAGETLEDLLRQYPSCTALQFNAAAALDAFLLFFPDAPEAEKARWKNRKRQLLEQVRAGESAAYGQSAALQLASLAILDGELDRADALLAGLPEIPVDPTAVRVQYFLKKGQNQDALKTTQKQLYRAVHQAQTCLSLLTDPRLLSRPEALCKAARASGALSRTFGLPDLSGGAMMEAFLHLGDAARAAEAFSQFVEGLTGPAVQPDEDLFSPWMEPQDPAVWQASARRLQKMALDSMQEEKYLPLRAEPVFAGALEKLRAAVSE